MNTYNKHKNLFNHRVDIMVADGIPFFQAVALAQCQARMERRRPWTEAMDLEIHEPVQPAKPEPVAELCDKDYPVRFPQEVTEDDAEIALLGHEEGGAARLHTWMLAQGWTPTRQAAGNVRWAHPNGSWLWLGTLSEYAAMAIVRAITGHDRPSLPHGRITRFTHRDGLDLLAEIGSTEPTPEGLAVAEQWDGGGMFIVRFD